MRADTCRRDTLRLMNIDELRERLDALFPQLVDELSQLVAIPSVSSDPSHAVDVDRSPSSIFVLALKPLAWTLRFTQ